MITFKLALLGLNNRLELLYKKYVLGYVWELIDVVSWFL